MFVRNIREILGVCGGGDHFTTFVDCIIFLGLGQSGCLWMFVSINRRDVGVCKRKFGPVLKSWVFVVFS